MKFGVKIVSFVTLMTSVTAHSQYAGVGGYASGMAGVGVYGGTQPCSYPVSAGAGASSYQDEIDDLQSRNKEAQEELRRKKSEKRRIENIELKRARGKIESYFSTDYADFMMQHMDNGFSCLDYKGMRARGEEPEVGGSEGGEEVQGAGSQPIQAFTGGEFARVCDPTKRGAFVPSVCDGAKYRNTDSRKVTPQDCRKSVADYRKLTTQNQKLQTEIEFLEETIKTNRELISDARTNYRDEQRENLREQMEGGICVDCMAQSSGYGYQQRETDWAGVATNVTAGLLATYMGYKTNKMTAQYNASIGYPTQSYPAWGYGFPFLMAGMYGALGGGTGSGGFGCASGMYGSGNANGPYGMMGPFGLGGMYPGAGGAFGYPFGMNPGGMMGGGMYPNGMGPWGAAGPWGMNPWGMGNGMFGGIGMAGGMAGGMGMYPGGMGMYPGGMAGGMGMYPGGMGMYPGGLGMAGSMGMFGGSGMYPGGMGMYPGGMAGGMAGGMGMYPGGMGMYPGGMGMYPGGMAGGLGMAGGMGMYPGGMGMYPGAMAGGMGMYPGGMAGGMGMYPGGMAGGLGMAGGMGSYTGMIDPSMQMQMQQQMMQMQMQQWQMQIETQRKYQEEQIAKQRVVMGLQQELQSLVYRIQQVQMGYGGTGYIGGGTSGGTILPGLSTGTPTPLPGSPSSGTGTGTGNILVPGSGATTPLGPGDR